MEAATDSSAIRNTVEQVWNEVLEVPAGESGGTFLQRNGHSVAALRIIAGIRARVGVAMSLEDLFDDPDLAAFAALVQARAAAGHTDGESGRA